MDLETSFIKNMVSIRNSFVSVLLDRVATIEKVMARASTRRFSASELEEVRLVAQKIHCTADPLGFPALGRLSGELEAAARRAQDAPLSARELHGTLSAFLNEANNILVGRQSVTFH